jgi:hypothetical protein
MYTVINTNRIKNEKFMYIGKFNKKGKEKFCSDKSSPINMSPIMIKNEKPMKKIVGEYAPNVQL